MLGELSVLPMDMVQMKELVIVLKLLVVTSQAFIRGKSARYTRISEDVF